MHELGIVFYLLDRVEELALEHGLTKVSCVRLNLGEVSGVVPSYLEDCWKWAAAKHELCEDCKLDIIEIKAINHCLDCGHDYSVFDGGRICPKCNSPHTELVQGREMELKELEAE